MTDETIDSVPATPSKLDAAKRQGMLVELILSPVVAAATTTREFSPAAIKTADLTKFIGAVSKAVETAMDSNLRLSEVTLSAQAIALDAMFNACAQRAALAGGTDIEAAETYLRLALKAQSQCRTTLLTLAEIKNPRPIAFVNQANFASGAQQVNNGAGLIPEDASEKISDEVNGQTDDGENPGATPENSHSAELMKPRRSGWTEERRARQAELVRAQKPWLNASGPKTELGKAISASNARKHFTPGRLGNHCPAASDGA